MSSSSQFNTDQAQALATVSDFHEYFSSLPPFTEGARFALPHALITVPFPPEMGGLKTERFDDMYERVGELLAKQHESGLTGFKHQLSKPEAEVWVSENIAAVLVGWSASMDGRGEFVHTVHLCTLLRLPVGISTDENPWRISGLIDMSHLSPEMPVPPVETGPLSEIIAPFEALLNYIKVRDWAAIPSMLLPGVGATISQGSQAPETFMWSEYIKLLRAQVESDFGVERKLFDCDARRCGDLGFVWAPFLLRSEGTDTTRGVSVCSFRLESGKWFISGLCETFHTK